MPVDPRAARWAAIDPVALWSGLLDWFPPPPARILDIGAGSGRDADWFAGLGHAVTCVEPDRGLWPAGADWSDAALPHLRGITGPFDLITISAVWHVLPVADWTASFERLGRLAGRDGTLIMSLRLPPLPQVGGVIVTAQTAGWHICRHSRRPSAQQGNRDAGVVWDWCVFRRVAPA